MRKLFTFLFAALMSVGTMFADGTKIGDLYYNLDAVNMTAEVTYKSYADYTFNEGWDITTANIPASVEYNSVTYSVTSIGDYAFFGCTGLTSIEIPNSVEYIGDGAFYGCTGLTSVTIPNSVTSIGGSAFEDCTGLTSVTIPNSVTSIGIRAFSYTSLTSIIIPNRVTSIGQDVFKNCTGLTSIEIPNSVTSIGEMAFQYCSGLTSITIPSSVEYIGEGAFANCSGLTSITIPSSVTSIGAEAFWGCTNITDVYCYPSATDLTWNEEDCNDFKDNKATRCHVYAGQLSAYQSKFNGVVNVTFVGDLTLNITANQDPQNASVYYSTFYDSANKYALPAGVEAYVADLSGSDLVLTKIAEAGQVLPENTAVILKAGAENISLIPTDATPVSFSATNDLEGVDVEKAVTAIDGLTTENCYVLSGTDEYGVGFYKISGSSLKAHKAYVKYVGEPSGAPRRIRFVFDQATGVESIQPSAVSSQKMIENGQLVIIRNDVKYNAQGQVVK